MGFSENYISPRCVKVLTQLQVHETFKFSGGALHVINWDLDVLQLTDFCRPRATVLKDVVHMLSWTQRSTQWDPSLVLILYSICWIEKFWIQRRCRNLLFPFPGMNLAHYILLSTLMLLFFFFSKDRFWELPFLSRYIALKMKQLPKIKNLPEIITTERVLSCLIFNVFLWTALWYN